MPTCLKIPLFVAACAAMTPHSVGAERLPNPYVARDTCPFECCTYGTWVTRRPLRIFVRERDRTRVAFVLAAGDSFQAVTGNVHVLRHGIAVARRPFSLYGPDSPQRVARGDRIYLLDAAGEGALHVWHKGRFVWTSEEYFYSRGSLPKTHVTRLLRDVESEWWVQVRARDGRQGWFRVSDTPDEPMEIDGADLCG